MRDLRNQLTVSSQQTTVVQEQLDASIEFEQAMQDELLVEGQASHVLQHGLTMAHNLTQRIQREMGEQRESLRCIACTTERKTVVFFCGHTTYCHACYKRLKSIPLNLHFTCPLCRVPIKNKIVYFAP